MPGSAERRRLKVKVSSVSPRLTDTGLAAGENKSPSSARVTRDGTTADKLRASTWSGKSHTPASAFSALTFWPEEPGEPQVLLALRSEIVATAEASCASGG